MSTRCIIGRVLRVEERTRTVYVSGVGADAKTGEVSLGWFVVLDAGIAVKFGSNKPDIPDGATAIMEFV